MGYAVAPVMQKVLGALPVTADFSRRLGIADIIDTLCPMRDVARISHGQVIEALIANRLTSPTSLFRVNEWAREWAVEEVYGLPAAALGDDRIARALDAIAPELEHIVGSVGAAAIDVFGIDVTRLHWDMTSISLYGAYDNADEAYPAPGWGHPKDRRTDLKQIQAGLAVSSDGGIPLWHNVYDGGAGEIAQVVEAMSRLQTMARRRDVLLVGDSKLISYGNVAAMNTAGVRFIAPLGAARVPDGLYASLDPATATLVDYVALRDEGKAPEQRGSYRVIEDSVELTGALKRDPVQACRRILVYSSGNAHAETHNRAKKLERAREDLDKLVRLAGSRYYPNGDAVTAKVADIARARRVKAYLRTTITVNSDGLPHLAWHFDQAAIDAEAAADGWYSLITNIPIEHATAADVLVQYKGQAVVERRYGDVKGPLAVAPLFLQRNDRITALITVICLALLIFSLIEREVRANLAPDTTIVGFYPYDNRAVRPTGSLILNALARMRLIPAHGNQPAQVIPPDHIQSQLLTRLRVDPTRSRWKTE
jgi:transposase